MIKDHPHHSVISLLFHWLLFFPADCPFIMLPLPACPWYHSFLHMQPHFYYDLLDTPFLWQIATFSLCSTPLRLLQPFSLSFPIRLPPVLLSLVFSPHVSISVCSYSFTVSAYAFVCSGALTRGHVVFFLLHPPTPLIRNFFREWPVPFYSPFASYQQSLRAKMERGNSYSQCCLLASFLISFCCFCSTSVVHWNFAHTHVYVTVFVHMSDELCKWHIAITCHVPE